MYQTIIEQCWDAFGHSPRRISLWDKWTLWLMDKPEWLQNNSDDDLRLVFENWGRLIREGAVVWGHVVQANGMLFEPGPHDCPGEMVFLLDQKVVDPDFLLQVARKLQSLKHTTPEDPGLRAVADHLTNEQTRRFGLPVPAQFTGGRRGVLSTVFFFRKHLPKGHRWLKRGLLPMIVHPDPPHFATVLPARFWPQAFLDFWKQ